MSGLQSAFECAAQHLSEARKQDFILFALRHGESQGQKNLGLYKERGDERIPLTQNGYKQSRAAGKTIGNLLLPLQKTPIIISSTGERSLATGAAMLHVFIRSGFKTPFIPDARLDKQKFGKFDGLFTSAERRAHCPVEYEAYMQQKSERGEFYARPAGGESLADVQDRLEDLVTNIPKDGIPRVFVTHGTDVLCIDNILMNRGEQWVLDHQDKLPNCAIRLFIGNFEDGFRAMDVEDKPPAKTIIAPEIDTPAIQ